MDNFQLRMVLGPQSAAVPFGGLTSASLEQGLRRLASLRVVATTLERVASPDGWRQLRALLGRAWPDAMPRQGQSRPSHVPAEEGCSAEVLEHLALDGELHRRLHSRPIPPPEEVLQHSGTEV